MPSCAGIYTNQVTPPPPPPPPLANSHRFQHTCKLTFSRTLVWEWVADSVSVCIQTRYSGKQQKRAGKCDRLQSTHASSWICNTQTSYTWAESLLTAWPKAVKYKNTFAENIAHLNPIRFFFTGNYGPTKLIKKSHNNIPRVPDENPHVCLGSIISCPQTGTFVREGVKVLLRMACCSNNSPS